MNKPALKRLLILILLVKINNVYGTTTLYFDYEPDGHCIFWCLDLSLRNPTVMVGIVSLNVVGREPLRNRAERLKAGHWVRLGVGSGSRKLFQYQTELSSTLTKNPGSSSDRRVSVDINNSRYRFFAENTLLAAIGPMDSIKFPRGKKAFSGFAPLSAFPIFFPQHIIPMILLPTAMATLDTGAVGPNMHIHDDVGVYLVGYLPAPTPPPTTVVLQHQVTDDILITNSLAVMTDDDTENNMSTVTTISSMPIIIPAENIISPMSADQSDSFDRGDPPDTCRPHDKAQNRTNGPGAGGGSPPVC